MKTNTLLAILCICFSINLHSQEGEIIYTDFEPDTVLNLVYLAYGIDRYLDINNDNIYDFRFNYDAYVISNDSVVTCYWIGATKNGVVDEYSMWIAEDLERNKNIGRREFCHSYGRYDYNILFRTDLGNDSYCYGWVRLGFSVNEFSSISNHQPLAIIYDMAYCTVPNYPLRVGQTSIDDIAINEIEESIDYVLFPSPGNDKITLKFNNHYYNTTDNEIKIYGIDGRLLKIQNSDFDNIDISNLSSGVYIMKIYLGNGESYTEKFVKE